MKSLAFGINDLCATGSLFSDQSEGWVLFHKIAQEDDTTVLDWRRAQHDLAEYGSTTGTNGGTRLLAAPDARNS